ncbi:uncharacterized protein LOC143185596 isoform X2 [Calliopsis andreniformis]
MQPGVTAVLAAIWLTVYVGVVGTSTLHPPRLALDQYSPLAPRRHTVYRRLRLEDDYDEAQREEEEEDEEAENQQSYLRIASIPTSVVTLKQPFKDEYLKNNLAENSSVNHFPPPIEDKQSRNFVGGEFTDERVEDRNTKVGKSPSSPPFELDDPFVADDTFQDQGPGSVEIYKLDLLREKLLLSPTPVTKLFKNKSKAPKKTNHVNWKAKTQEYKATSPKIFYKQSNSFDDPSTEMPPDTDPFSIGGVPELQVGCEGLEASDHKQKRSIDSPRKSKKSDTTPDLWADALEINYDSSIEDDYEEMDELVKIIKLENTTKSSKPRGDMDATLEGDFLMEKNRTEKLPVRGDMGNSSITNDSSIPSAVSLSGQEAKEMKASAKATERGYHFNKAKQAVQEKNSKSSERKRSKREIWGFGEDEGVVSSDELQTENHRRRQHDEWLRQEAERRKQENEKSRIEEARRRGYLENRTNSDVEKIREEYERSLEQRKKEEEERRRRLQEFRRTTNWWQPQDEYRRRVQEEETRRNRLQEEERRRGEFHRRHESHPQPSTEKGRHSQEEEVRRREENRLREEERRRHEEEIRREQLRREEETRRRQQQEQDRKSLDDRRRQWMLKKRQEQEEEERRRQQQPSNLLSFRARNESRPYGAEAERQMREQQEKEREQKLRDYVQRNRPIKVNASADRQREEQKQREEEKRRKMEEQKLQEYIRRNQPVHVPQANQSQDRNWMEYRRKFEVRPNDRSRYPGPGDGRRNHGPSASTNIDPQNYMDEIRRRQAAEEERIGKRERQDEELLRQEALRREEEVRRIQSRRYEEQRKRQEAARLEDERRRKELMEEEARRSQAGRRPGYEDRRRFEEYRRRQDTRLIPSNLLLNESRRTVDLQRQRQEQERWRMEDERRRLEESRAKEAREDEERARAMKELWRRKEEARLNALPVSARIIIRPVASSGTPNIMNRGGFDNDVNVPNVYPNRKEQGVPPYPVSPTQRPRVETPQPCVWAVVQCCPVNIKRLVTCFEAVGCPGINWDPSPCRFDIVEAARERVRKFYAEADADEYL